MNAGVGVYMIFFFLTFLLYLVLLAFAGFRSFLTHGIGWQITTAILAAAGIFVLFKYLWTRLFSILSRLRFCAKLKRWAKENQAEYATVRSPLASFFQVYAGEDIRLKTAKKEYRIKFFPYFVKKSIVHIVNDKEVLLAKQWALFFVAHRYGATAGIGLGRPLPEEMLNHKKSLCLSFGEEAAGEKIVVISPSCYKITCVNGNSKEVIDNDYVWSAMSFWFQKQFFRLLDREETQ